MEKNEKVKVYRILGWILFIYGIVGYFANLLYKGIERGIDFSYPAVFGAIALFVLNIFLWAGLILLWRADANEKIDKKSKWLKFIKIYAILSLILIIAIIIFPFLIRGLRS
jgi:cytochrome bd-type quinol oxidase subunit 2